MQRLGEFELHAVSDGFFRLDGGAMFGIVPRPLWEKIAPPDERNRIRLALTTLLIRTGRKNILVDSGIGTRRDARFADMYGIEHPPTVPESLRRIGLGPEEIDLVVLSHLHFDHAGGAMTQREGRLAPTYPKATHIIQEGMWEEALQPNPRTRGSYIQDDFVPLREAGLVKFVKGDEEIAPGVRVRLSGGHVRHHQVVEAESGGRKAIFWADLLPTSAHVKPAWVMGYDLYPAEVAAIKEKLVEQAAQERWLNVFEHDPKVAMGFIVKDDKGFRVETVEAVR